MERKKRKNETYQKHCSIQENSGLRTLCEKCLHFPLESGMVNVHCERQKTVHKRHKTSKDVTCSVLVPGQFWKFGSSWTDEIVDLGCDLILKQSSWFQSALAKCLGCIVTTWVFAFSFSFFLLSPPTPLQPSLLFFHAVLVGRSF